MELTNEQVENLYNDYINVYADPIEYSRYTYNSANDLKNLLLNGEVVEIRIYKELTKRNVIETLFSDMINQNFVQKDIKPYELYSSLETYLAMYLAFILDNKLYKERY